MGWWAAVVARVPPPTSSSPAGGRPDTVTLRSAKSEESLSSQASGAGEQGGDVGGHYLRPSGARRNWGPGLASKFCTSHLGVLGLLKILTWPLCTMS